MTADEILASAETTFNKLAAGRVVRVMVKEVVDQLGPEQAAIDLANFIAALVQLSLEDAADWRMEKKFKSAIVGVVRRRSYKLCDDLVRSI